MISRFQDFAFKRAWYRYAAEDRVCGTIDIEKALTEGTKAFEPGLLAKVGGLSKCKIRFQLESARFQPSNPYK